MRFSSVAFGLPYLLIELHSIGVPVVRRTVGHLGSVQSRDYQIFWDERWTGRRDSGGSRPSDKVVGGGGGHPDPDFFGPSDLTLA